MPPEALIDALRTPGTVLLDTSRPDAENDRVLLFAKPERILAARRVADVPGMLKAADEAIRTGRFVAGYVGYEAGYAFEPALFTGTARRPDGAPPLAWLGVYERPRLLSPAAVAGALPPEGDASLQIGALRFGTGREDYRQHVARVKAAIRAGEVYQINYTAPVRFRAGGDPLALYRRLRARQPVPYGAFLNVGNETHVLSASPELFLRRDGERVWTRPMKGTVRRGATPAEDRRLRRWLAADEKSRAENLMIVDLLRNDLSVCCRPGSVRVPCLFEVEPYETVAQMTSTVEGRLKPGLGYGDLFRALFPCGSVTGAPKLRAMQHIRRLERQPRGVYCGTIGFAGPREAVFNVAIRTVELQRGAGQMGIGSGLVWDSDADAEYDECVLKAQFLTAEARSTARSTASS